jgi:hypothetical protein
MKRREFIAGLGSAAVWPLAARAGVHRGARRCGVADGGAGTAAGVERHLRKPVAKLRNVPLHDPSPFRGPRLNQSARYSASSCFRDMVTSF